MMHKTLPLITTEHAPIDGEIIGSALQECDRDRPWIPTRDQFAWYWAVGRAIAPATYAEFGVRYGYSMIAVALGALSAGCSPRLFGYDREVLEHGGAGSGSNAIARSNVIARTGLTPSITHADTQSSEFDSVRADLIHVDADHTYGGALRDLETALRALEDGGVIIVDDVDSIPDVRAAADVFIRRHGLAFTHLPSFRGMYVICREGADA